jgi:hypothetical protein
MAVRNLGDVVDVLCICIVHATKNSEIHGFGRNPQTHLAGVLTTWRCYQSCDEGVKE